MSLLSDMVEESKDLIEVNTNLLSIDKSFHFKFNYSKSFLNEIKEGLNNCRGIELDKDCTRRITLLDSYDSATIEGARTTLDNIISGKVKDKSYNMVIGCIAGMQDMIKHGSVSVESLLSVWSVVVNGCCENRGAGDKGFRTGMVYVGNEFEVIHTPARPEDIYQFMELMVSYSTGDVILDSILYHFYIAYIHPFCDGNGRTARIVNTYLTGVSSLPLSKSISRDLREYYASLRLSESVGDLSIFFSYMMERISYAIKMYEMYSNSLSEEERFILSKMDKRIRASISIMKASKILRCDELKASDVLRNLVDKGYLEYNSLDSTFTLIW